MKTKAIIPSFDTSVIPMGVGTFMQERFSGYDLIADDQFLAVGINYNKYSLGKDVFSLSLKKNFFYKQSQVSFPQFGFGVPDEGPLRLLFQLAKSPTNKNFWLPYL